LNLRHTRAAKHLYQQDRTQSNCALKVMRPLGLIYFVA
jgi:hypothetical protein